jgi:hypothetical protein
MEDEEVPMYKSILLAPALALAIALPASAVTDAKVTNQATRASGLSAEVVEVQTRPSPVGVIARDVFGGALAGAAVGGGVVLYNHYVTNNGNGDWGNWGRTIGIGAAIGAGVGLVFGAVDAASNSDRVYSNGPVADQRDVGFAPPTYAFAKRW